MNQRLERDLTSEAETAALAATIGRHLRPGDTLLLDGPVGAGKSVFARAIIRDALAQDGAVEDIPSPTFTIVQVYQTERATFWHTDLYRLGDVSELEELGLTEAFDSAICLVEWPERLGSDAPARCLHVTIGLGEAEAARRLTVTARGTGWDWVERLA